MSNFYQSFQECGLVSFPILAAGILAWTMALAAGFTSWLAPRAGRIVSIVALCMAVVPVGLGAAAEVSQASSAAADAAAYADDPNDAAEVKRIENQLLREGAACTTVGLWCGGVPVLVCVAALLAAFKRARDQRTRAILEEATAT